MSAQSSGGEGKRSKSSKTSPPAWATTQDKPDASLVLVLPLPPSGNHAHEPALRRSKRGRVFMGKAVRAALAYCARERMFLEVRESKTALERRPEQPGPVGWLNSSRTHWSNGESAAYYRDPRDLRDFLAGSALNALIAQGRNANIARDAYVLADEMLRARGSKVCFVDPPFDISALVGLAELMESIGTDDVKTLARKGLGR